MNTVTILAVAFILNGQPSRVELLSQSMQGCMQDTFLAQTVLNRLGATILSIGCETRPTASVESNRVD
jgi:hypothetical protein